jgi:hypothetical protein
VAQVVNSAAASPQKPGDRLHLSFEDVELPPPAPLLEVPKRAKGPVRRPPTRYCTRVVLFYFILFYFIL